MTDDRFGRWTVLSRIDCRHWLARCDCGAERIVFPGNLRSGKSTSCGHDNKNALKHGKKPASGSTKEWRTYYGMLRRCLNPKSADFKNYGGRGIAVCQRWLDSFESFLSDMGPPPSPDHSIDRIDNDRGYSPENCRWATRHEQNNNKRNTRAREMTT